MSNPQQTTCDAGCNQQFTVEFITDRIGNGVDKIYFICPNCQHEYVAFYKDSVIQEMQDDTNGHMSLLSDTSLYANERESIEQSIGKIRAEIKERMDTLRVMVEGEQ